MMSISGPRKRPSSFTSVPQLRSRHQALLSCRHERQGGFKSLVTPERSADGFFEPADYGVGANSAPPRSRRGGGACAETGVEGNVPTTTRDVGRGRRRGGRYSRPGESRGGDGGDWWETRRDGTMAMARGGNDMYDLDDGDYDYYYDYDDYDDYDDDDDYDDYDDVDGYSTNDRRGSEYHGPPTPARSR